MRHTYETELEIGNIRMCVEIEFSCTKAIKATYWEPAEGGEIGIEDVWVSKVSGDTYDLSRDELGGWKKDLDRLAWDEIVDGPNLYDTLHDVATYNEDRYEG